MSGPVMVCLVIHVQFSIDRVCVGGMGIAILLSFFVCFSPIKLGENNTWCGPFSFLVEVLRSC